MEMKDVERISDLIDVRPESIAGSEQNAAILGLGLTMAAKSMYEKREDDLGALLINIGSATGKLRLVKPSDAKYESCAREFEDAIHKAKELLAYKRGILEMMPRVEGRWF